MNLDCDVVLDLVSTYKDGAASEGTAAAIEEHLRNCRDCRRYYRQYDSINRMVSEREADSGGEIAGDYTRLSSSLKLRRVIGVVFLAVCGAVTVTSVVFAFIMRKK